ncbi:glycosyltransferase [Vibrio cholerae]|uniref:glycosyltransferase n=1 Tax=Vibrio cholerae TaxID=666 RepID=UPI0006E6C389|nr:glycosyltransferase [Vibrio cholerae]KQA14262.1 glycosyl transferase family 2 [Vibrio cholerae]KQA80231.1 glycosyl transferase family 2 [Vibrio cholerae]KQA87687.1 glycosyl transferase family 2 [Vibrio cholerae]PAR78358.1 glycosyl transferase family 2 [Vibrio cholerae]PAR89293.1 glycosyl transferase family 2 [Vibrio cholerae]
MKKSDNFITIIVIVENNSQHLNSYLEKISSYVEPRFSDYEIVVIDQNSQDNTEKVMDKALISIQSVRYIKLAQKVPNDVALAAGIENAIGDFVININPDRDPLSLINDCVELSKTGYDIVVGTSKNVNSFFYKIVRKASNCVINTIGYTLPENSTGTFCLSRRAVNAITESGRFYCKLHMRMANIGYPIVALPYEFSTKSRFKKNLVKGISETLHHMIFNSTKPLRWMSFVGIAGSSVAMLFSIYSIVINFVNDKVAEGWTTTILFMSFLFMLQFLMLSFFGEYLARLLDDRSEHREYNVIFEKNSSVMLDDKRENVSFDSLSEDMNLVQTGRNK